MKNYLVLILSIALIFGSCTRRQPRQPVVKQSSEITVNAADVLAGANFDLQALGEMVKKTANPSELEKMLNTEGSINNLDLDSDGNVDVIKVTEYGESPNIGLSFCAILPDGEPEFANIEINTTTNQVVMSGNETYYGSGHHYTSHYSPSDYLLFAYLARPHRAYHSPYYYGHYGSYYRPYVSVGYGSYSNRSSIRTSRTSKSYTKTTTRTTSKIKSPNKSNVSKKATATANKKSAAVKQNKTNRSVANTKKSQKTMQARDKNKAVGGGGFKSTANKSTAKKTTPKKKSSYSKPKSSSRSSSSRSSSRRCDLVTKKNIITYDSGLSKALAMNVVNFNYAEEYINSENLPATTQVGFIAQELETVLPEAVHKDNGLLAVDYATIAANNTKALQELNDIINKQNIAITVLLKYMKEDMVSEADLNLIENAIQ